MIEGNNQKLNEVPVKKPKRPGFYIDVVSLCVVPLLLIVVAMLYMTQVSLDGSVSFKQLGVESVILYAITMAIYILLRSYSRRLGRNTENWKSAFNAIEKNNDEILKRGFSAKTGEYCRDWETNELKNSRSRVLADAGITIDDFNNKYLAYSPKEIRNKYTEISEFQYKTICAAKKIKRLKYDENYLSVYNKNGSRKSPSGYMRVKTLETISIVRVFITTAISSVFVGSIVLDVIADPTFATVVMCLVKIATIIFGGVMGMFGGYNMTATKEVEEMSTKADEQRRFVLWCETYNSKKGAIQENQNDKTQFDKQADES